MFARLKKYPVLTFILVILLLAATVVVAYVGFTRLAPIPAIFVDRSLTWCANDLFFVQESFPKNREEERTNEFGQLGSAKIFKLENGTGSPVLFRTEVRIISDLACNNAGTQLAYVIQPKMGEKFQLWTVDTLSAKSSLVPFQSGSLGDHVEFAPDGDIGVVATAPGTETRSSVFKINTVTGNYVRFGIGGDDFSWVSNDSVIATHPKSADERYRIEITLHSGNSPDQVLVKDGDSGLSISPDKSKLVFSSLPGIVDINSGNLLTINLPFRVSAPKWLSNDKLIFSGINPGANQAGIFVFEISSQKLELWQPGPFNVVILSPDRKKLATTQSGDNGIRVTVLDAPTPQP